MGVVRSAVDLQPLLDDLTKRNRVPGAVLGILDGDDITILATGAANLDAGIDTTPGTLFQIGSITKVWTTTLVMQLVDEGTVEVDEPVRSYLPQLTFGDERFTERITVRHLLTHTSGVDGDFLEDTGRGDDCLERYVAACSTLPHVASPGDLFSYCNAGFSVAGRLLEVVAGKTWDHVLGQRLLAPLGLRQTASLPEEAILHRVAIGHLVNPQDLDGGLIRAPMWFFPRSCGPAAAIVASASDLLRFVQMHVSDGNGPDGSQVLSPESTHAMQERQVDLVEPYSHGQARGLGWGIYEWNGHNLIGHDGGTIGQASFLRVLPEDRFAIVLLTNGQTGRQLYVDLFSQILAERGIELVTAPEPAADLDFDPQALEGDYDRNNVRTRIEAADDRLFASAVLSGPLAGLIPPIEHQPLDPVDASTFLIKVPGIDEAAVMKFFDFDQEGRPRYMHLLGRAARRVT